MNQLCKVCGEPAAGFHFGAFTCEGCKSFFGRTYNNISAIAGCKNNGDCIINKKNRTACKACRLRKCLLVGMSKSGSRYGRRSNWFKIHCLLQEQHTTNGGGQQTSSNIPNASSNNLEQLARLQQIHARQTYQDKTNPCIKSAIQSAQETAVSLTLNSNTSAGNLNQFLNPAKFLHQNNHNYNHSYSSSGKANESSRLSDTPSDSGASSAGDPTDDCTSNASNRKSAILMHERNCNSAHLALENGNKSVEEDSDERERRRQQFLHIFRSHSEPIKSPFAAFPFTYMHGHPLQQQPAHHHLPPPHNILAAAVSSSPTTATFVIPPALKQEDEFQEEPIDLTVKSRSSPSPPPAERQSNSLKIEQEDIKSESTNNVLDLTLVRTTQALTG